MIQQFTRNNDRHLYGGRDVMKNIFFILDFVYFFFGLITVTVEVFLRRDFGERYFTRLNFTVGFFFLGLWTLVVGGLASFFSSGFFRPSSMPQQPSNGSYSVMFLFFIGYILLGSVHFIAIWWRNRTDQPLHSLDSGKSWLLPLGKLMMGLVNIVAWLPIKIFSFSLSGEDKKRLQKLLPLVPDSRTFTERFLEPAVVLFVSALSAMSGLGVIAAWLFMTAILLAARTNYRHETDRHQFLQLRDQILEAKYLPEAMAGASDVIRIPKTVRDTVIRTANQIKEDAPEMMEEIKESHPSLADALAAINKTPNS